MWGAWPRRRFVLFFGGLLCLGALGLGAWLYSPGHALAETPLQGPADDGGRSLADSIDEIDRAFGDLVVDPLAKVFFYDLYFWDNGSAGILTRAQALGLGDAVASAMAQSGDPKEAQALCEQAGQEAGLCTDALRGTEVPFIVAWLVAGALFFTFRFRFANLWAFGHAFQVIRGTYDHPDAPGEVTHFQALASALSATVGLGNIAGVAVAVGIGGPGAVFWMIVAGFLGMSSKFAECTLGQMYRQVSTDGHVLGGPMRYLKEGLGGINPKWARMGGLLAGLFSILCIGASFGGGNMFQANQSAQQMAVLAPFFGTAAGKLVYGVGLAVLIGVVILGGIRRIGAVAGVVVPVMCGIYVLAGAYILVVHAGAVPGALMEILREAWSPAAGYGGFAGALITGFRRAAFSNEAGVGSAPIAHAAAATDEPVREGIVALLEPFVDTLIVCTMTGLVLVVTGGHHATDGEGAKLVGITMTSWSFAQVLPWFPLVLAGAAFLFAFSTMLSWSYYGERCWAHLFGHRPRVSHMYKMLFLVAVVLGSVIELSSVLGFADLMQLGMAFPNILGVVLLSGVVDRAFRAYWKRYKAGEFDPARSRY